MADTHETIADYIELSSSEGLLPQVFAIVERHFEQGDRVLVYAADEETADAVDRFLWTSKQNSFIPHARRETAREPVIEPVLIVSDDRGDTQADVLVLASGDAAPDWFLRFDHIYDFAPAYEERLREAARGRYAACKEAGYRMRFRKS